MDPRFGEYYHCCCLSLLPENVRNLGPIFQPNPVRQSITCLNTSQISHNDKLKTWQSRNLSFKYLLCTCRLVVVRLLVGVEDVAPEECLRAERALQLPGPLRVRGYVSVELHDSLKSSSKIFGILGPINSSNSSNLP